MPGGSILVSKAVWYTEHGPSRHTPITFKTKTVRHPQSGSAFPSTPAAFPVQPLLEYDLAPRPSQSPGDHMPRWFERSPRFVRVDDQGRAMLRSRKLRSIMLVSHLNTPLPFRILHSPIRPVGPSSGRIARQSERQLQGGLGYCIGALISAKCGPLGLSMAE